MQGRLLRRYKRFLADVELEEGEVVTALCPNTGTLKTCSDPGSTVLLSRNSNPRRKTRWTWEATQVNGIWVGINTLLPNRLVAMAVEQGWLPEFQGWRLLRREAPMGQRSRVDLLLERNGRLCYLEIKNVTMVESGIAFFPDAVTARGTRHLRELEAAVSQGHRGVIFFLVQREDGRELRPADGIDPKYGQTLRNVVAAGVEAVAYRTKVTPNYVELAERLPVVL